MKKRMNLLLVPLLALGLSSCGEGLTWQYVIETAEAHLSLILDPVVEPSGYKDLSIETTGSGASRVATIEFSGFKADVLDTYVTLLEDEDFVVEDYVAINEEFSIEIALSGTASTLKLEIKKYDPENPGPGPVTGDGWKEALASVGTKLGTSVSSMPNPSISGVTYKFIDDSWPTIEFVGATEDQIGDYWESLESKGYEYALDEYGDHTMFAANDAYGVYLMGDANDVLIGICFDTAAREAGGEVSNGFPYDDIIDFYYQTYGETAPYPNYTGGGTSFETTYEDYTEEYGTNVIVQIYGCTQADMDAYATALLAKGFENLGYNSEYDCTDYETDDGWFVSIGFYDTYGELWFIA